jgi:hypothetical protein
MAARPLFSPMGHFTVDTYNAPCDIPNRINHRAKAHLPVKGTTRMTEDTANASQGSGIQTITIQGYEFEAPAPYTEGHQLSTAEAAALNQLLAENLRNNFRTTVQDAKDKTLKAAKTNGSYAEGDEVPLSDDILLELQLAFTKKAEDYEFAGRRGTRAPVDPVEREAYKMAKAWVLAALKKNKSAVGDPAPIDPKSLPEGKLDQYINGLLTKRPDIREEAKRRVSASQTIASDALNVDELTV